MEQSRPRVPAAVDNDSSDVAVALEAAATLWDRGEHTDALAWLRRAGDLAIAAGDFVRALALASAAADLRDAMAAAPNPPKSSTPPPPPVRASARPAPPPPPSTRAPGSAPPAAAPARVSKPPPPPSARVAGHAAPAGVAEQAAPAPKPAATAARVPSATPSQANPATLPRLQAAVRVSVKLSVRDPNLLLVRILPEGQAAPLGAQEAVLTPAIDHG
jgi:hypothetical protein